MRAGEKRPQRNGDAGHSVKSQRILRREYPRRRQAVPGVDAGRLRVQVNDADFAYAGGAPKNGAAKKRKR